MVSKAALRAALVVGAASLTGACAISQIGNPFRSSEPKRTSWTPSVTEERLLEAARSDTSGNMALPTSAANCPKLTIWPQDRLLTVYEIGRVGDSQAIRHRGEVTKTARECSFTTNSLTIKYGFAGRILLGPKGKPGTITMPLKVRVSDRDRKVVSSQNMKVSVSITEGDPVGYFSAVNEVTIPLPPGVPPNDFNLFVAFDRGAGESS